MKTIIPKQTENIIPVLQKFKNEVQNIYHNKVISIILFGSYARGKAQQFSDVDILLVLSEMNSPFKEISITSELTINYLIDYDINISIVPTTIDRFTHEDIPLYRNIKKEGIIL